MFLKNKHYTLTSVNAPFLSLFLLWFIVLKV